MFVDINVNRTYKAGRQPSYVTINRTALCREKESFTRLIHDFLRITKSWVSYNSGSLKISSFSRCFNSFRSSAATEIRIQSISERAKFWKLYYGGMTRKICLTNQKYASRKILSYRDKEIAIPKALKVNYFQLLK